MSKSKRSPHSLLYQHAFLPFTHATAQQVQKQLLHVALPAEEKQWGADA